MAAVEAIQGHEASALAFAPLLLSRVLGWGGSTSRISRRICGSAAALNGSLVSGVVPVARVGQQDDQ